jgi:hypothetical protein
MATEAQINANRANARNSAGPRTPEGKAVVSQNAVTRGFLARETVIQGEDPKEFEFYRDRKKARESRREPRTDAQRARERLAA